MKRILQFERGDDHKIKTVIDFLINALVDFKVSYKAGEESTIVFECDDTFYDWMMEEVPRLYQESIEL